MELPLTNLYAELPERFYSHVKPTPVRAPRLLFLNRALCAELGVDADALASEEGVAVLAGNAIAGGSLPVALAYAGHQFGSFVPQLGDGRAILLGELADQRGLPHDVQLKGAGPTPFSRRGDGRAALGPVLREVLVSEAMAALGIPTTRALAAVATGEDVLRDERLPGAVLTRVARSHLRVGTFQYFAVRQDREALARLSAFALARHYPAAPRGEGDALALIDAVLEAQAALVARWLGVGFIHGVMNTDNCAISGETLDFGPCAFLDGYDPAKKFSSIDHQGRYAFAQQPKVAHWNVARLCEALLPLIAENEEAAVRIAGERLERYPALFAERYGAVMGQKLGLTKSEPEDRALTEDLLERMSSNEVDFTLLFRRLCDAAEDAAADDRVAFLFQHPTAFHDWAVRWRARLAREAASPAERAAAMRRANPAFIPRNHRVEQALAAAARGDLGPFERLHAVLARPYEDQPEHADLTDPPLPREVVRATFCGT